MTRRIACAVFALVCSCKKTPQPPPPEASVITEAGADAAVDAPREAAPETKPAQRCPSIRLGPETPEGKGVELVVRKRLATQASEPRLSVVASKIIVKSGATRVLDPDTLTGDKADVGWNGLLVDSLYLERMHDPVSELRAVDLITRKELWRTNGWMYNFVEATPSRVIFFRNGALALDRSTGKKSWSRARDLIRPHAIDEQLAVSGAEAGAYLIDAISGDDLASVDGFDIDIVAWSPTRLFVHQVGSQDEILESYERAASGASSTNVLWTACVGHRVANLDGQPATIAADAKDIAWVDAEDEDGSVGRVTLIDASTGQARWSTPPFVTSRVASALLEKDTLWILPQSGALRVFDRATGKERWRYPVDGAAGLSLWNDRIWLLSQTELVVLAKPGADDPAPPKRTITLRSTIDTKLAPNTKIAIDGEIVETNDKGIAVVSIASNVPCVVQGIAGGERVTTSSVPCEAKIDVDRLSEPPCRGDCGP